MVGIMKANENSNDGGAHVAPSEEQSGQITPTNISEPGRFLGLEATRAYLFPGSSGPSKRSWSEWRTRGYFSVVKIGGRVFADPSVVRAELTARFTIPAATK
jgi:hypothetical protein